jgi:hypothetical protein
VSGERFHQLSTLSAYVCSTASHGDARGAGTLEISVAIGANVEGKPLAPGEPDPCMQEIGVTHLLSTHFLVIGTLALAYCVAARCRHCAPEHPFSRYLAKEAGPDFLQSLPTKCHSTMSRTPAHDLASKRKAIGNLHNATFTILAKALAHMLTASRIVLVLA